MAIYETTAKSIIEQLLECTTYATLAEKAGELNTVYPDAKLYWDEGYGHCLVSLEHENGPLVQCWEMYDETCKCCEQNIDKVRPTDHNPFEED